MVTSAIGAVVLVPFPFSDLTASKLRPALVLADAERGDWVCLQITSNPYADSRAIELTDKDFAKGKLERISYIRPGKLFTANEILFQRIVGTVGEHKLSAVLGAVVSLLRKRQ